MAKLRKNGQLAASPRKRNMHQPRRHTKSSSPLVTPRTKSKDAFDAWWIGPLVFVIALGYVSAVLYAAPKTIPECDRVGPYWFFTGLKNASSTARELSNCASKYDAKHPHWMLLLYVSIYVFLQMFGIPGPLLLSLTSGALWPLWKAQAIIGFCATFGASLCYILSSKLHIERLMYKLNAERVVQFQKKVKEASDSGNLLFYMLFLRVSPMLPNWFINLTSPAVGVPLRTFALATAIGLIPANIIHYYSGQQIHSIVTDSQAQVDKSKYIFLFSLQFLALLPTFLKSQLQKRFG